MEQVVKEERFDDGGIKERLSYRNGVLHGFQIYFYENGSVKYAGYYLEGLKERVHESFYENGRIKSIANYHLDKLHGVFERCYENGQIRYSVNIDTGAIVDGPITFFRSDGSIEVVGHIENELPQGEWTWKDKDGYLLHKRCYNKSIPIGIWGDFYSNHQIKWKLDLDYDDWLVPYHEHYETGIIKHSGYFVGESILNPQDSFSNLDKLPLNSEILQIESSLKDYFNKLKYAFFSNLYKENEWLEFSKNGKLIYRREYDQKRPIGIWKQFSELSEQCICTIDNGKRKRTMFRSPGKSYFIKYFLSGKVKLEGELEYNGEYHYIHRYSNKEGGGFTMNISPGFGRFAGLVTWEALLGMHIIQIDFHKKVNYKNRKGLFNKRGTWKEYYESGKLKSETTFDPMSLVRQYIQFHPNGKLQYHGNYRHGQKSGYWLMFNKDGFLTKKVKFSDGVKIRTERY